MVGWACFDIFISCFMAGHILFSQYNTTKRSSKGGSVGSPPDCLFKQNDDEDDDAPNNDVNVKTS